MWFPNSSFQQVPVVGTSGKKWRTCYLAPKTLSWCIFRAFISKLWFPYSSFQQVRQHSIPSPVEDTSKIWYTTGTVFIQGLLVPMLWHSAETPGFFTNRNILHTLKNEPLNIMLLHTSRRMDGPWINMVPVVSHIFDVSSSTGLGIEGCWTCWKDE